MKKNRILLLLVSLALAVAALYGTHEYFKSNPDTSVLKPSYQKDASVLLDEFSRNDSLSTRKYLGKVILIRGIIRGLEKSDTDFYTLVIGDRNTSSSIRCSIDRHHSRDLASLKVGDLTEVKGIFTGYNKDDTGLLGSDAELNRCVVLAK